MSDVQVTQEDREAAAAYYYSTGGSPDIVRDIRSGAKDGWFRVQAFARHRLATRPAPVGGPVAVIRFDCSTPGNENEMPKVISCNWLPDGEYPLYTRPALDVDGLVERVAREIDPPVWENYDRTLQPFIENRGAHSSIDDPISYEMMWKDGCRTAEDAKLWWMTTDRPVMVRQERWRASLVKATAALAAIKDATDEA